MSWTKADLARMQSALDWMRHEMLNVREYTPNEVRRELNAKAIEIAPAFVRAYLRDTAERRPDTTEGRACARLATRLESEPLPASLEIPQLYMRIETLADLQERERAEQESTATGACVDWRSEPTPTETHPIAVRVDERLAYPVQAVVSEQRFVIVHTWQAWGSEGDGSTDYDAPRETWHAWASDIATELGAAKGWASISASEGVADGSPASEHVRRILCEAAAQLEPPSGIVALDLCGLGLRIVEAFVQALVAAADARFARDGWVRCGVLICDQHPALYLQRCARLHAEAK